MSNQISRRQFLWSAGAGVSALALAACVPATLPAAQQDAAPAAEPLKLTVWSSFSGKNGEAETELVKRFNESQSNVVVDYQFQGNYEETAQKVTAALQAPRTSRRCLTSGGSSST